MIKQLISVCALSITTTFATAGLIESRDYMNVGDGDITYVADLQQEWLDFDLTRGLSPLAGLNAYAGQGFRIATMWDYLNLCDALSMQRAGSYYADVYTPYNHGYESYSIIRTLQLIGAADGLPTSRTIGMRAILSTGQFDSYNTLNLSHEQGSKEQDQRTFNRLSQHPRSEAGLLLNHGDSFYDYAGVLMVRGEVYQGGLLPTAVPEPGTLCLIGAALGFAGLRMRRRTQS